MTPQYLNVQDVMRVVKVARSTAYELMYRLGAIKIGRSTRLMKAKLDTYLRELERGRTWTAAQTPVEDDVRSLPLPEKCGELSEAQLRATALAVRRPAPSGVPLAPSASLERWDQAVASARLKQQPPLSANRRRLQQAAERATRLRKAR
jgi:hypothetical protein